MLRKVVEEAEGLVPGDIEGLRAAVLLDEGLPLVKGALDELIRVAAVGQERVSRLVVGEDGDHGEIAGFLHFFPVGVIQPAEVKVHLLQGLAPGQVQQGLGHVGAVLVELEERRVLGGQGVGHGGVDPHALVRGVEAHAHLPLGKVHAAGLGLHRPQLHEQVAQGVFQKQQVAALGQGLVIAPAFIGDKRPKAVPMVHPQLPVD